MHSQLASKSYKTGKSEWCIRWLHCLSEDLDWVDNLAKENMRFNNGKLWVWHLRRNNPRHQLAGTRQLESSFIRKDLSILMNKLKMSQQCALMAVKIHTLLGSTRQCQQNVRQGQKSSRLSLGPSSSHWMWYVIHLGNKCHENTIEHSQSLRL